MFDRVYERNSRRKKESKFENINQPPSIRHCKQIKFQLFQFQGTKSWESSYNEHRKKLDISQKYVRQYLKYALLFKIIFYNKIEFWTLLRRSRRSSIFYWILRCRLPHPQPIPIKHALNPIRK